MTTRRMLELEASNLERMRLLQNLGTPLVNSVKASVFWNLSPEQESAAREILASSSRVTALEARAGTGKTSRVLAPVRVAAETDGYTVVGLGPTSRASKELRHAGIDSATLQKFLMRTDSPSPEKRLLILDEASLASTRNMHELLNRVGKQDCMLVCGGRRQHEAVEAGARSAPCRRQELRR
jgi:ATP-dependent exoDNAse (exonuclease V) alpha subunit